MKKWLLKWFLPTPEQMADVAVDAIAKFINSSDKTETIAKYSAYASQLAEVQTYASKWLLDGKISDDEKVELKRALLPLAQKIVEAVR